MGLSEQMLRMSGIGGLHLEPIWWQGNSNGKSVPPVDNPLPLQQVSPCASMIMSMFCHLQCAACAYAVMNDADGQL